MDSQENYKEISWGLLGGTSEGGIVTGKIEKISKVRIFSQDSSKKKMNKKKTFGIYETKFSTYHPGISAWDRRILGETT